MQKGRQTRTLRKDQIERLEKFRKSSHEGAPHGYSLPQLRLAMAASFGWRTLQTALRGRPVWDLSHNYIAQWIERYLPAAPMPVDGKAAASGERENDAASGEKSSEEAAPTPLVPSSSQRDTGALRHAASEEVEAAETDEALEGDEPNEEKAGATGTIRGSR